MRTPSFAGAAIGILVALGTSLVLAEPTKKAADACTRNADCSDGSFCNGVERCLPSSKAADPRGCVSPLAAACPADQQCDETSASCIAAKGKSQAECDSDHDGQRSIACGGTDCDDHDVYRYRGNPERCGGTLGDGRSARHHDEDCDPCTVSGARPDGDNDNDELPAWGCSNAWLGTTVPVGCDLHAVRIDEVARRVAGVDCDDSNRAIVPGAQVCVTDKPGVVNVCLDAGTVGPPKASTPWETRKCHGTCNPQPNGTGVCIAASP